MANVMTGTFVLVSALSADAAIDVRGAHEQAGTEIWMYRRKGGISQIWSVLDQGDGSVNLVAPLSGRCLSVYQGKLQAGQNVIQWNDNATRSQAWDIVPDGNTMSVDGTDVQTAVIQVHGTTWCLSPEGGKTADQTHVEINAADGTDAQRWALVPADVFQETEGTYKILSALDEHTAMDIAGRSTAKGANLQVYTSHDGKNQSWKCLLNADGTVDICNINSGLVIDDAGKGVKPGTNAQQWGRINNASQHYLIHRAGSMKVNGQPVPTYYAELQLGEKLVLDRQGSAGKAGSNVVLYTRSDGKEAQQWAFIPTAVQEDNLPTPSRLSIDSGIKNNRESITVSFSCNASAYQVRASYRRRLTGAAAMGDWSPWMSPEGVSGNEGWGDPWTASMELDNTQGDAKSFELTIPEEYRLDGTTVAASDVKIEVRSFEAGHVNGSLTYPAHGYPCSGTFELRWRPAVTVAGAVINGEGLHISYTSDIADGGCVVKAEACGTSAVQDGMYGGSGSVLLTPDMLDDIPSGTITASVTLTRDIPSARTTASVEVEDAAGKLSITPKAAETAYGTYTVSLPTRSEADKIRAFVHMEDTSAELEVRSRSASELVYETVPPLREGGYVLAWVSRSDGWYAAKVSLPAVKDHAFVWIWRDPDTGLIGGSAVLDQAKSDPPKQTDDISRSVETYETVGREYHAYRLHKSKERSLTVTGAVAPALSGHGSLEDFMALLDAGHATFRNPRGEVLDVCVSGISQPLEHDGYTEITVTQHQETR